MMALKDGGPSWGGAQSELQVEPETAPQALSLPISPRENSFPERARDICFSSDVHL